MSPSKPDFRRSISQSHRTRILFRHRSPRFPTSCLAGHIPRAVQQGSGLGTDQAISQGSGFAPRADPNFPLSFPHNPRTGFTYRHRFPRTKNSAIEFFLIFPCYRARSRPWTVTPASLPCVDRTRPLGFSGAFAEEGRPSARLSASHPGPQISFPAPIPSLVVVTCLFGTPGRPPERPPEPCSDLSRTLPG